MKLQTATFAMGCFWCGEAVFNMLRGVSRVVSGFSGGSMDNPSYEDLHYKDTGHVEAIQIMYDPTIISYRDLLDVFWRLHDPTTLNQPGTLDNGPEYRSVIFYNDEEERKLAEETKKEIEAAKMYKDLIITEIIPYQRFFPADESHQDFYRKNPNYGYCRVVIDPKIEKLKKNFSEKLK